MAVVNNTPSSCPRQTCAAETLPPGLRLAFAATVALTAVADDPEEPLGRITVQPDKFLCLARLHTRLVPDHGALLASVMTSADDRAMLSMTAALPGGRKYFRALVRTLDRYDTWIWIFQGIGLGGEPLDRRIADAAAWVRTWAFCDLRFLSPESLRTVLAPLSDRDWARLVRGADRVLRQHLMVALGDDAESRIAAWPPLNDVDEEEDRQRQAYDRAMALVIAGVDDEIIKRPRVLTFPISFMWFPEAKPDAEDTPCACPFTTTEGNCALAQVWQCLFEDGDTESLPRAALALRLLTMQKLDGRLLRRFTPAARGTAVLSVLSLLDRHRRAADPTLDALVAMFFKHPPWVKSEWPEPSTQKREEISYFLPQESTVTDECPLDADSLLTEPDGEQSMEDMLENIREMCGYTSEEKPAPPTPEQLETSLARFVNARLGILTEKLSKEERETLLADVRHRDPWLFRHLRPECWCGFADLAALSVADLRVLTDAVSNLTLAVTLFAAPPAVRFRMGEVCPDDGTGPLSAALRATGPYRQIDIRDASRYLLRVARDLILDGKMQGWSRNGKIA